ncbi:MAG: asparagine synthase (glutamine-hydrolyzing) [Nitrospirae bacterium]|nr:asparagine synthase (glutamine-hydrolyzing) [Nitrospirota bacterium]
MCGIAGIIDLASTPERSLIESMCRIMKHRGPDGEGYYIHGEAALGHRRLSIIDLEGGRQPMSNEDGTVWITFNGEIYNFPELREQLIAKGHVFKTRSDTETIVHAYEEYGVRCIDKLRGMFAFGLWDQRKKMLLIARDRLGKKPVYYYSDGKKIVFASELKAVLQDKSINRELDLRVLEDYLMYHYIPFPSTIFKGIYKLPPGHYMTVEIDTVKNVEPVNSAGCVEPVMPAKLSIAIKQYWDVEYKPDNSLSEDDWVQALREKLKEAVKIRLISDVPLGAFLSGGIDSSTIVALMSMAGGKPVKTFSIGFKETDFSEVQYARKIAEQFGTEHHEMVVEPDAIEMLPLLAWDFDEPFADASAIPTYYVSKMARQHVTVILSGDGGDEIFAGYRRYKWARDMNRYDWLPVGIKKILFGFPASVMPEGLKGKGMLRHLSKDPFERYAGLNTYSDPDYLNSLLSRDVRNELKLNYNVKTPNYSNLNKYYEARSGNDDVTKIQYMDTKTYLAEDILTKVDRASLLCSLETRAPLLDHEIVELAARIPSTLKIKDGETKYILKKTMKGILPDNIL